MDVNETRRLAAAGAPVPGPFAPGVAWGFVPPQLRGHKSDTVFFEIDFLNVAAGASLQGTYQTPNAFGILVTGGVAEFTAADGITPAASFAAIVQLTDPANNVLIGTIGGGQNGAPIQNVFGTSANQPAYWPVPKWIGPAQNLTAMVTSREAVVKSARLTFWGVAVSVNAVGA